MSEAMMWLLVRGIWETLAMTFVSGFFGFVIGLPVGVLQEVYTLKPSGGAIERLAVRAAKRRGFQQSRKQPGF